MVNVYREDNDESQSLIDGKTNSYDDLNGKCQVPSSRLEWAEFSWTRWLYVLCWWWISPILSTGYNRSLTEDDLDPLPHKDQSFVLLHRLQFYDWTFTSTWKILIHEFWKEYMLVGLYCVPYLCARIAQPLILRQLVITAMNTHASLSIVYTTVILLCLSGIIQVFLDHQISFYSMRVGIRIRNALSATVYKHSLAIDSMAWTKIKTGRVVSLIANDVLRFEELCVRLHFLWEGPLEVVIIFALLCWIIRPIPALLALTVFVLSMVVLFLIGRYLSKYRDSLSACEDQRLHAFTEFIHGCYITKMYNWEKSIEDRIFQTRQSESIVLRRISDLRTLNATYSFILSPLLALTTFAAAWSLDYRLTAVDCFTTLVFFNLVRNQVAFLMSLLTERLADVQAACKRIDAFMRLKTISDQNSSSPADAQKGKILMSDACFSWHDDYGCLSSLNVNIQPGTFVGVVGTVGSGKSSLLAAIVGEMTLVHGHLNTSQSSLSYASQSPWIFADTIRNNILLNRSFDEQRYRDVIHACCLDVDLNSFGTSGDLTIIGEKGVNLSGGQKARVSLARALYNQADIYLIDDPLAAVDGTVAKQIYERCFSSEGLLKNKTRLLVTHQTQFLRDATQIIFLSHGHIDQQGNLDQRMASQNPTSNKEILELESLIVEDAFVPDARPIISDERSVAGNVNWSVWFRLFTAPPLGIHGLCLLIILLVLGEVLYDGTNYWLSIWLKQIQTGEQHLSAYAYTYFGLTIATMIADVVRTVFFFTITLNGADSFHNNMVKGLLYTSIQFFESNPSGRILSRASKDQGVVDLLIPTGILYAAKSSLTFIGAIVITCLIRPYILLVVIALVPFVLLLCRFYLRSKSQLKRLESLSRSPVLELLSTSLNGLATIRAFKVKDHFIKLLTERIDRNTRAYINIQGANRWFALRLNLLPFINMFATAVLLVGLRHQIDPSLMALCLMYAISIPKSFQISIQQFFDADVLMTSAERIDEYSQLPAEEDRGGDQRVLATSPEWPANGTIHFRNYSLRHRSGMESVLKNIDIRIESTEKIGIIGRTGAGKSSLFKGIFRFIDRSNIDGQILIDDVDISRLTLNHLRSHLSIIPQQPILFSGTMRYNLDPFDLHSDEQCWMALDDIQLKSFVLGQPSGLRMVIDESGRNLSAGQCQLVCIARAILKKSKILLIDEATSNVDQQTDEIIQKVIAEKFQQRTVLTIAHRLNTVAKCDRILVLDQGVIVNYDTPSKILQQYQHSSTKA